MTINSLQSIVDAQNCQTGQHVGQLNLTDNLNSPKARFGWERSDNYIATDQKLIAPTVRTYVH